MCGIVGYAGGRDAQPILIDCLKRLEYRGYDSSGIAIVDETLGIFKSKGEIAELESRMPVMKGTLGIAHTRWATQGKPTTENAHPLADCSKKLAVVHNGIISNFMDVRDLLVKAGHIFSSDTDSEVFAHLVESELKDDLVNAVFQALEKIEGTYAFAVVCEGHDGIVATRRESPLVVGIGDGENFLASDVTALLKYTNRMIYLLDGDVVRVTKDSVAIRDSKGNKVEREPQKITWNLEDAEKSGYPHFMLKEIFEQPDAIHDSLLGRIETIEMESFFQGNHFSSVKIVACGTSYHAGLVGKYIIEELAKIPTTVQISSEYRYSSVSRESPLVVLITQSGETADTLGAAREARKRGNKTLAIANVVDSAITREVDHVIYTRAGPEIGVAATKTFVTQLIALYLLAMELGVQNKSLAAQARRSMIGSLRNLPRAVQDVLNQAMLIEALANKYAGARDMFFIGRSINYPVALEGALKTKEISYVHGEGFPAGEMKHGPLALLSKDSPVVAIAIKDHTYDKMLGNISEVSARSSPVIAIGYEGDTELARYADDVIWIREIPPVLSPVPVIVVLQLWAYYIAKARGCPIDKPRNIAKTVTVE
ncbi:MAG: glutamine--fructose-6-phosphate transaminase (isomerizing) [Thermoplasmatota archaeon]|nr:glutamine--fructose-6-phosphate transaminase (isomerizing) [Candidatus Thermoplasmatota archaeon]MBU1914389.1 glutamine--fructose-6-phosphate transaminase (isomerizing) [Candidatus Thermoplasmatota archaeon]